MNFSVCFVWGAFLKASMVTCSMADASLGSSGRMLVRMPELAWPDVNVTR